VVSHRFSTAKVLFFFEIAKGKKQKDDFFAKMFGQSKKKQ
jgi:hypothetical protein